MKKKLIIFGVLFWLGSVIFAMIVYYHAYQFLNTAPATPEFAQEVVVDIPPGASSTKIAEILLEEGLITDVFSFKIMAKYLESENNIQAGRFKLNTGWLPQQVLEELVTGKPFYYRLTIREGLTWWELGKLLEEEGYVKFEDFKTIIHDPEFLAHWGIPFANAEGFLYPDTYFLPKPNDFNLDSAKAVAGRLIDTFWRKTTNLWAEISPNAKPDKEILQKYLTLASIVEKETGIASERATVAGVYTNRLKRNMLLQADPTVAYGMGANFKPPLLKKHLEDSTNPYNTYSKNGLPPGPICSPSLASLEASVKPESHDYLYFVAKGTDGSHNFSKTLNEHNRFVQQYRANMR